MSELSPADWEASWGIGAARSVPDPFLPLTRWERRTADLLCARGLDGYAAHMVMLANRFWWMSSPWWWLVADLIWEVHREWASAVEAGTDLARGHYYLHPPVAYVFGAELHPLAFSHPHDHLGVLRMDQLLGAAVTFEALPELPGLEAARELGLVGVEGQHQAVLGGLGLVAHSPSLPAIPAAPRRLA